MSQQPSTPQPHAPGPVRSRSRLRKAAIIGSAVICLAASGVRSDGRLGNDGPRLMTPLEAVASMSDTSIDVASLVVLGLSLIGGGRMIRRVRQRAAHRDEAAWQGKPSRAPIAATHIGSWRVAR